MDQGQWRLNMNCLGPRDSRRSHGLSTWENSMDNEDGDDVGEVKREDDVKSGRMPRSGNAWMIWRRQGFARDRTHVDIKEVVWQPSEYGWCGSKNHYATMFSGLGLETEGNSNASGWPRWRACDAITKWGEANQACDISFRCFEKSRPKCPCMSIAILVRVVGIV